MKQEYIIRLVSGTMVLIGIALSYWISAGWLLLPVFVGVNLIQSTFTKFCPLETLLGKLKKNR